MFTYLALILAQIGTSGKQYAMKHCGKIAPGAFNSICINVLRTLICLAISVIIWLFSGMGATTTAGHIIIIISGIGTALNLFTWILSSRMVSLTLLESACMIGSLVLPLILAPYLYNGDSVSLLQWVGCALIFLSLFLFMDGGKKKDKEGTLLQKISVILLCVAGLSLASIFKKYYTYYIADKGLGSIEYFTLITFLTALVFFSLLFFIYYFAEKKRLASSLQGVEDAKVEFPYKKVWHYILIAAAFLYLNELFTVYASRLPSAIYYPLSRGLSVGCTFLLDVIAFKDKVTLRKLIGLAVIIVAIILVNL